MAKVLIALNTAGHREHVETIVRRMGHEVAKADTVKEAIVKVDSFQPELIVSDLEMTDGDGLDILAAVRSKDSKTPFVLKSNDLKKARAQIQLKGIDPLSVTALTTADEPHMLMLTISAALSL